jgi:hypothetical protein
MKEKNKYLLKKGFGFTNNIYLCQLPCICIISIFPSGRATELDPETALPVIKYEYYSKWSKKT